MPSYTVSGSPRLEQTGPLSGHLNKEKNILYFQNFGGGGVGLGLLLGPLGAAANASMIEGNTKKDIERLESKIDIKPRELFAAAAHESGVLLPDSAGSSSPIATPYLYVSKVEDGQLQVAAALLVAQGAGAQQWTGKYMYQLPQRLSMDELANLSPSSLDQLKADLQKSFGALLTHILSEKQEHQSQEQKVFFKSDLLSPRFDLQMLGSLVRDEGTVVWVRTLDGVYGIQKTKIWFEIQKS